MDIKPYKSKFDYSYTLGAFPTYELIKYRPDLVIDIYCSDSYTDKDKLSDMCKSIGKKLLINDKLINKLSDKENVYVVGIFKKSISKIDYSKSHLMLNNPSNMGNVGTILRTALAFDYKDIAIITPGVDIFNPKVVRASMGAIFHLNIEYFDSFDDYKSLDIGDSRECFSFMLTAEEQLTVSTVPKPDLYTLIFGNEATGLPEEFKDFTNPIIIPQSEEVDSLNLTIAAGIGMYMFKNK